MIKVLKLNSISNLINTVFDAGYDISDAAENPDAILVRSAQMADYAVQNNLLAVGRAGAGVNNIPHAAYIGKGVVVFNTPGANANAVKELVISALLLCGRKIYDGICWAQNLKGKGDEVKKLVEKGKSQFVGREISGKTLGVIGLGAIGRLVADSAIALGMNVIGYDAFYSKEWKLSDKITIVSNPDDLYAAADFITIHIPYTPSTDGFINAEAISKMKDGVAVINAARGELVSNADIIKAVNENKVSRYVTDFPTDDLLGVPNIVTTPHLGASTPEAEDNCAVMVAKEIADYIENGNIKNSVNYPALNCGTKDGARVCVLASDEVSSDEVKAVLGSKVKRISSAVRGRATYIIADLSTSADDGEIAELTALNGVYRVRSL